MRKGLQGPRSFRADERGYIVAMDSGQVSAYRPAQHTKPGLSGLIQRIQAGWQAFRGAPDPSKTTEQGAAGSSSPAIYQQTLWAQRYERRNYIADIRELMLEDPRLARSLSMYCFESVRGGFKIKIDGKDALSKRAQKVAEQTEKLLKKSEWYGIGYSHLQDGESFVQAVVLDNVVRGLVRMPTASMERLSDDADQIIDPNKAFAQIDTMTNGEIATFPVGLMCHARWNHTPGDRYGTPEFIPSRRLWRILKLMEESNSVSRMSRAAQRRLWSIGSKDIAGDPKEIEQFKAMNGVKEGVPEIFDPTEVARDYYGNGLTDVKVIAGDPNQDDIKDILHVQNALTATALWPSVLYGLDAESVNRDVVKDIRAEALKGTERMNEALNEVVEFAFDLQLILLGIDPNLIARSYVWTTSTIETPSEVVEYMLAQLNAGGISLRTYLAKVQQYNGFESVDEELALIQKEASDKAAQEVATAVASRPEPGAKAPATNGKAKTDSLYAHN